MRGEADCLARVELVALAHDGGNVDAGELAVDLGVYAAIATCPNYKEIEKLISEATGKHW